MGSDLVTVDCPFCEARTSAERKKAFLEDMSFVGALFHMLMILITTFFWMGVLTYLFIIKEKTNKCLTCKQKVGDEYLVAG